MSKLLYYIVLMFVHSRKGNISIVIHGFFFEAAFEQRIGYFIRKVIVCFFFKYFLYKKDSFFLDERSGK